MSELSAWTTEDVALVRARRQTKKILRRWLTITRVSNEARAKGKRFFVTLWSKQACAGLKPLYVLDRKVDPGLGFRKIPWRLFGLPTKPKKRGQSAEKGFERNIVFDHRLHILLINEGDFFFDQYFQNVETSLIRIDRVPMKAQVALRHVERLSDSPESEFRVGLDQFLFETLF